jgi:hypothetical protein
MAMGGIARSSFYYRPRPESAEELERLTRLDRIFTNHPVYGSRRLSIGGPPPPSERHSRTHRSQSDRARLAL